MIAVLMESGDQEARQALAQMMEESDLRADRWLTVMEQLPSQPSGRTRSPTLEEVNARSAEIRSGLQDPGQTSGYVVLAGSIPLWVYRPDLRPAHAHGRAFVMDRMVLFPIHNPAAALRAGGWARQIRADLSLLGRIICADDWTAEASNACMWCEVQPEEPNWDSNGVLYCADHWRRR